ncbi:uncharacterized protein [Choristoneura fumiferana]|uniref:uncharacterized protein n=1 Tax=Choristoneura fumiferana TaxID=7141 RepID=UPI003D15C043
MSVGRIGEFEVAAGNWTMYVERLAMYFKVNEIKAEMQLPTLIAVMGEEAYELLSTISCPKKPAEMSYTEVIEIMRNHMEPKPSFMAERYRLRQRRQGGEETVSQFLTDLKKLAKFCEFGSALEENIRDQFTCGLRSDTIKQRLFAEHDLTYKKAVRLALSLEAAEKDAAMVERPGVSERTDGGARPATVNSFSSAQPRGGQALNSVNGTNQNTISNRIMCAVCGRLGHRDTQCPYKDFVCNKCGEVGHLKRVCPARMTRGNSASSARGSGSGPRGPGSGARDSGSGNRAAGARARRPRRSVYHVQAEGSETPHDDEQTSTSDVEEDLYHLCLNGYKPV